MSVNINFSNCYPSHKQFLSDFNETLFKISTKTPVNNMVVVAIHRDVNEIMQIIVYFNLYFSKIGVCHIYLEKKKLAS